MKDYTPLLQEIGYNFKNHTLLEEALTHPSYLGLKPKKKSYERLEFLGDVILAFIITDALFKKFPTDNEGTLTKRRTTLINGKILSEIGKEIRILDYLQIVQEKNEHDQSIKVLENAIEALIGAIYLDGGIEACKRFIMEYWHPFFMRDLTPDDDPKTYLQEWSQKRNLGIPKYTLASKSGEEHAPLFTVEITVRGLPKFQATGSSKKIASHEAAKRTIEYIKAHTLV